MRQKCAIKPDIELPVAVRDDVSVMHLSMVCPRMGGGGGGGGGGGSELIGTHNILYCSTERFQREIIAW